MNERIRQLAEQANWLFADKVTGEFTDYDKRIQKFAELIIEETLSQVDEKCYGRGENQWYYEDDKQWIRLHFGYGEIK